MTEEIKNEEKKIVLSETQFNGLLDRIKKLETPSGNPTLSKKDRIRVHEGFLRHIDGDIIINVGQSFGKKDSDGEIVVYMPVETASGEKKDLIQNDFLVEDNKIKAKILKRHSIEDVKSYGTFQAANPNPEGDKSFRSFEVESEVVTVKYEFDLEILEGESTGKKIHVNERAFNLN